MWLMLVVFVLILNCLWMSQLCQTLYGVQMKQVLCAVPERLGKLVAHPALLFLVRGNSVGPGSSPGLWAVLVWDDAGKMKLFFLLFFVWLFSAFLFHCIGEAS